jgi:mRNA-degrading endonuclease RelE of RelBE toxin-antitoxin system
MYSLDFAKPLTNLPPLTHRFRIGKYRVSFYIEDDTIFIERVELRGQASHQ